MNTIKSLFFLFSLFFTFNTAFAQPHIAFSDITSGPDSGIGDNLGDGSIVTIWGHGFDPAQNLSKVYYRDSQSIVREAAHIYYWGKADGSGGPAKLFSTHKLYEISFSIPDSANGTGEIYVEVSGKTSNSIPFTVRSGNIFHVKISGNNSNNGSYNSPWQSLEYALNGQGVSFIKAGDIIYGHDGVAVTNGLQIGTGNNDKLKGTETHPISLLAYPNSSVTLTGLQGLRTIRNFYNQCDFWNFSKLDITTTDSAISSFHHMRVVGVKITGPNAVGASMSGAIGGSGVTSGGARILGVYIHDYGNISTNYLQHVLYLSNRSGVAIEAFEIAYGRFENNGAVQTLHIYDHNPCGGWTGTFKIHDNYVLGNRGNAFNFNLNCSDDVDTPVYVYNNIISVNESWSGNAIRIEAVNHTGNIKIYNNTIFKYKSPSFIRGHKGTVELINNIFYHTENIAFWSTEAPEIHAANIFYTTKGTNPPSWATGSINADPLLTPYTFQATKNSPTIDNGSPIVNQLVSADIFGVPFANHIGATYYHESIPNITIPNISVIENL